MMTTSGQAGALIAGRYRLERPTGGGTWPEEIWQGFDETLNRPVMLRLLPLDGRLEPDLDEQVQSVVAQVARLGHPNIAQVYDVGHEAGMRYVVSEWTGGRTLGQIMSTGRQRWQRTVDWGQQIAEALAALHGIGLVDGVLGPETVSVMDDRRVKLTDVGLGIPQGGRAEDDQATRMISPDEGDPTQYLGSGFGAEDDQATRMMSPQGGDDEPTRVVPGPAGPGGSRGAVPAGASADVYALGAILWTAMLGMAPEVGPEDTAGPDTAPLRETGAPADLVALLQSMLAASASLRPSASVAAHRFGALAIEARESRSEPTAALAAGAAGAAGATQAFGGRPTQPVGPLRPARDEEEYEPAGAGSGSGRRAGIAIGVILLLILAGVALALVLGNKNTNANSPTDTTSVTAPTTSPGVISVSTNPNSTSAAPATSSAPAKTTSSAPATTTSAPATTTSAPATSASPTETATASASASPSATGGTAGGGTATPTSTSTAAAGATNAGGGH
jgi:serine/threonine protein kinase